MVIIQENNMTANTGEVCSACNGTGRMVRDPDIGTDQECFVCEGTGRIKQEAQCANAVTFEGWLVDEYGLNVKQAHGASFDLAGLQRAFAAGRAVLAIDDKTAYEIAQANGVSSATVRSIVAALLK
jgi:RecJ-like exonuclease